MCGIAGILSPDAVSRELLLRMTRRIAHRGPDDEGLWIDEDAGIGWLEANSTRALAENPKLVAST